MRNGGLSPYKGFQRTSEFRQSKYYLGHYSVNTSGKYKKYFCLIYFRYIHFVSPKILMHYK